MSAALTETKISEYFQTLLSSLSEKERIVLTRRIGLNGEKQTLQFIGDSFSPSITRERVRQIEESSIRKLGRIVQKTELSALQELSKRLLQARSGVATREQIIEDIILELEISENFNSSIIDIIVQADTEIEKSKPKLGVRPFFFLPSMVSRKEIESIHTTAVKILKRKKDVVEKSDLFEDVLAEIDSNSSESLFINILSLFEDVVSGEENLIGLTEWRILNPKTLRDKAYYVMKKEKTPLHFVDIANKISQNLGEPVKINTVHNELIRNSDFVLIGRGIYALKEWGFKSGTVLDVIVDIMGKHGEPMNTQDIVAKVLKVREVKKTTIYMNLQNKTIFERVGRNYYKLKDQK